MNWEFSDILAWMSETGLKIVLILVITWLVKRFGMIFVEKFIRKAIKPDSFARPQDEKQREDTLIAIVHAAFGFVLIIIAIMLILDEIGLNIGPLIASAGIVGVALGFGGQWLIKDLIAGLFVIFENQYRVGDVVTLYSNAQPISGLVEDITLRMTMLRDLDGQLHHVPNGSVTVASNMSMDFAGINLDIGVSYEANLEKVIKTIDEVGQDLAADKDWSGKILEPPKFLRVNDFADSSVVIKITGKTLPLEQWAVTGELRKRIKIAFDKAKIEIPYPQRTIHNAK